MGREDVFGIGELIVVETVMFYCGADTVLRKYLGRKMKRYKNTNSQTGPLVLSMSSPRPV